MIVRIHLKSSQIRDPQDENKNGIDSSSAMTSPCTRPASESWWWRGSSGPPPSASSARRSSLTACLNWDLEMAVAYWNLVLTDHFKFLGLWNSFLLEHHKRLSPKDTWNLLLDFGNIIADYVTTRRGHGQFS
ncbi:unnamed protein product [Oncorhynchus mykiss]|uniref:DCUN1 domain-containing protein n=1 Tax=Oncorhynchus mykiss TaxID=8022 RepID=A0A060XF20_ONCMY|nr:unnamed protein product [Oncorhynchus mykiss]